MYPYKSITGIITISILAVYSSYSNASMIVYERDDIEKIANENNIKEIEHCAEKGSSACSTILGGAYYWGLSFYDKRININDSIAIRYFKNSLIESLTSRSILSVIIEKERSLESKALLTSAATERYYPAVYRLAHPDYLKTNEIRQESIKWRKIQMDMEPSTGSDEKGFIGSIYLQMTPPDYTNALYWLNRAITEEDDMLAERNIAKLYAEGKGVEKDYITAYMYYDLAGTAGAEEKSKLAELMTPEQVQEGLSRSHEWQDEHHSYRPGYGAWNDMGGIEWHVH
ncbi:SEL1-like repeat protein [Zymobacter palmae]|nr:hypothetical protein [Zymobacter palmae]